MATPEQLREHTGRRPFAPFWLRLGNGETLFVTERFRAVVMPKQIVVSPDGVALRWIGLNEIADHGVLSPMNGASQARNEQ